MKKYNLVFLLAIFALLIGACNEDEETDTGIPGEVTIDYVVNGNVVEFTAEAENATSYTWDLGNGETPTGASVQGTYVFPGAYDVTCTAVGRIENTSATVSVQVDEGDPAIFSDINVFLSGYNAETGQSETTWVWAEGDWNMSCGAMDVGMDTCYFMPIDESWWHTSADAGEEADPSVYDDEYTFNLDASMSYENNFGTEFMLNWMYAIKNFSLFTTVWGDVAYDAYEAPAAQWSVEYIPNSEAPVDTLTFQTVIEEQTYDGVFVIHLTNSAYFGYGAAGHDYQICSYTDGVLLIRYDNSIPEDIYDYTYDEDWGTLEENGITAGEKEWDYIRLVKKQ